MIHRTMHMKDYVKHLDRILEIISGRVLKDAGKISHNQALDKAKQEYHKEKNIV